MYYLLITINVGWAIVEFRVITTWALSDLFVTFCYNGQKPDQGKFEHVQCPMWYDVEKHRTCKFLFYLIMAMSSQGQ